MKTATKKAKRTEEVQLVDVSKVHVSKWNTRQPKKEQVAELVASMRKSGQLTAALARPHPKKPGEFELAAGARRRLACQLLKIPLKLIVREMSDKELRAAILTENLQRENPDPLAEAAAIEQSIAAGEDPRELAALCGKDERWLRRRMKLLAVVPELRALMEEGQQLAHYSTTMAEFLGDQDAELQLQLGKELLYQLRNCSSLGDLIELLNRQGRKLEGCSWLEDPATFVAGCGPGCRADSAASLFPDPDGACGQCLNRQCFDKRRQLAIEKAISTAVGEKKFADLVLFLANDSYVEISYQGKQLKVLRRYEFRDHFKVARKKSDVLGLDLTDVLNPQLKHLEVLVKKGAKKAAGDGKKLPGQAGEAREDMLRGKRLAALRDELVEAVKAYEWNQPLDDLARLVAAFGTRTSRAYHGGTETLWTAAFTGINGNWATLPGTMSLYEWDTLTNKIHTKVDQALWEMVRPVLLTRVESHTNKDLLTGDKELEMRNIAKLIDWDLAAAFHRICTVDLPPPKSWGKGFDPITLERIEEGGEA